MRLAGLAALLLAVLTAVFLVRTDPGPVSPTRLQPDPVASTAPRAAARKPPQLTRDPFQYADRQGASAPRVARGEPVAAPPPSTPAAAVSIRLIGFVRGDTLRAALVIDGEVVLVGVGEKPLGYEVVEVDEDSGVRMRDRSGETFTLIPP